MSEKQMISTHIDAMVNFQNDLLNFIDDEDCEQENFANLIKYFQDPLYQAHFGKYINVLYLISKIVNNHHRSSNFFTKIEQIILEIRDKITQNISNTKIYDISKNNKALLLLLIKNKVLKVDEIITENIINHEQPNRNYWVFFYPEMKNFLNKKLFKKIRGKIFFTERLNINDKYDFELFDEKRLKGENDSYICELIREDKVVEFIQYVNRANLPLTSQIKTSMYETNIIFIRKTPTIIEYAAFFGSIQIIKYLMLQNVDLNPSLFIYATHSRNAELIHLLEDKMSNSLNNCQKFLKETIKCHHFELTDYINNNFQVEIDKKLSIKYFNYAYYPDDFNDWKIWHYLSKYDYFILVKNYLLNLFKNPNNDLRIIFEIVFLKNNEDIIQIFLDNFNITQKLIHGSLIKTFSIPSSVITINGTFSECSELSEINIPSSVTSIGYRAFDGCSRLTQISIPSSVTSIGNRAFERCSSLKQITIPSSVTYIGDYSFNECMLLTQITIPSSVTSIGDCAFCGCSSLTQISIPSSVTSIGDCAFSYCIRLTQISIPSSVTSISGRVFSGCSRLTQITIPSSVTSIGWEAFSGCSRLTQITIPSSVTSIKKNVFSGCSSLTQITIPSSVTSIGEGAFSGCSGLTQITIPSSVTSIGDYAFYGCSSLTQITIPSSVTSIKKNVFSGCSRLTQITIPSSVTSISGRVFSGCSRLTQITIPSSVTSIGECAFSGCSGLTQITIPSSVTSIGDYAFYGCSSLTQITIPSSVTSIGDYAFYACSSLTQITIPSSIDINKLGLESSVKINTI